MRGAVSIGRTGPAVDRSAACILAAAVGWAFLVLLDAETLRLRWTVALTAAAASWHAASALLGRLSGDQLFTLPEFSVAEFEFTDSVDAAADELVLDTVLCAEDGDEDELLLEDALPLAPDTAQVIRLFDPAQMPTAGELYERIDRHLATGPRAVPDSTQELHAALSALRQTLR